jgi:3-hydroxy-9,10-secoandrosta-1,3,5(10)-triene-9,17-dione monooxygenase
MTRASVTTQTPAPSGSARTTAASAAVLEPGLAGPLSLQVPTEKDPAIRFELERLLARARDIRSRLRKAQAQTEIDGQYSQEVHEYFLKHGFYRMLQPKMFGGLELGVSAFYQVVAEVARGCPSTAWCLSLSVGHSLTLGSFFEERAQREVFGENGYMICPASGNGKNMTVERVDGGWEVSGFWRYCSGAPYSTHFMATAHLPGELPGDAERRVWMILRRADYEVQDDWGRVIGMRGSGSNSIKAENAFVPDYCISEENWTAATSGETVGSRLHGNPVYAGTFFGFAEGEVASTSVGLGYAAVDEFEKIIRNTRHPWVKDGAMRSEYEEWQRVLGMAISYVDAAQSILVNSSRLFEEYAARSVAGLEAFDDSRSMRLNGVYFVVEELVWKAVDLMLHNAGSQNSADGAPLQRYFRDILTTRTRTDTFELFSVNTGTAHLRS